MARTTVVFLVACGLTCAACFSLEFDDCVSAVQLVSIVWSSAVDSPEESLASTASILEMGAQEEPELEKQQTSTKYCLQGSGIEHWDNWTSKKKQLCCRTHGLRCLETLRYMHNCFSTQDIWTPSRREWCCNHRGVNCNETEANQLQLEVLGPRGWPYDCRERLQSWDIWRPEHKRWCCMVDGVKCNLMEGEAAANMTSGLVAPETTQTNQRSVTPFDCREGAKAQKEWSKEKKDWCSSCTSGLHRWRDWDPYKKDFCCRFEGIACREAERYIHVCDSNVSDYHSWSKEKQTWCCKFKGERCPTSRLAREEWGPRQFPYDCREHGAWERWTFTQQKWCCKVEGLRCGDVQRLERGIPLPVHAATQFLALEDEEFEDEEIEVGDAAVEGHVEQTSAAQTEVHAGEGILDAPVASMGGEAAERLLEQTAEKLLEQSRVVEGAGGLGEYAWQSSTSPPELLKVVAAEGHPEQSGAQQTEKVLEGVEALEERAQQSSATQPGTSSVGEGAESRAEQSSVSYTDVRPGAEAAQAPVSRHGVEAAEKPAEQGGVPLSEVVSDSVEGHAQRSGATPAEARVARQSGSLSQAPGGAESGAGPSPLGAPDSTGTPSRENGLEASEGAPKPQAHEGLEASKADSEPTEQSGTDLPHVHEAGKPVAMMGAPLSTLLEDGKPVGEGCWKIGERVEIAPSSDFDAQAHGVCATVDTKTCGGRGYSRITFDNEYSNWYEYQDLQRCATLP